MIRVNEIKIPLGRGTDDLKYSAAKALHIRENRIRELRIAKRSVDSRKKNDIRLIYSVDVIVDGDEEEILRHVSAPRAFRTEEYVYQAPEARRNSKFRPVVVGFGPAGMFAGLILAKAGYRPLILERGGDVDSRTRDVETFWRERILDTESNVQFGEGGAGTFSDGKLTTGIKDPRCREVFLEFCRCGAPEEILYDGKPHIGTDKLGEVVKNLRHKIIDLGGEVRFRCRFDRLIVANKAVHGITYTDAQGRSVDYETDTVILATGHSSRDTVHTLYRQGITMARKPFSVGARIEHPQSFIDTAQYGAFAGHPDLGAADYKLACHPPHGRGAYTFCMCPGGTVVCASSEEGGVVVNGMSNYARDGRNANSAILVGIEPEDLPGEDPLAGIELQRQMERAAFDLGGGNYSAVSQLVGDFLDDRPSTKLGSVAPTCPTGVVMGDITRILPEKAVRTMREALPQMDRKIKGFAMPDAVLTAPESRSSSPVRLLRDEFYQSNVRGLYPCGEGAGYAGGIVSAAVDGIRVAEAVLKDEAY